MPAKNNAVMKILAQDREFSKNELSSLTLDVFKDIDKAMSRMSYEDLVEIVDRASEITSQRENSVYARYVLAAAAFIRRPHEDNIFMQNLLITFYDNHNWTVVEFICDRILSFNENKYALRILADCYEEKGLEEEKWKILERLVKVDFDEKKITKTLGDHFLETGDTDKAIHYYRRALTRCISSKDSDNIRQLWSVLLDLQKEEYGYLLGIADKVAQAVDRGLALTLLTQLYPLYSEDPTKAILILKKALEIDPHSTQAREELVKTYRKKYAKSTRLATCIKNSGLENSDEDIQKAISFFETDIGFDVGSFVYQRSTGKLGLIQSIDDRQVVVAFNKTNKISMTSDMAFKALTPLPKNNIMVLKTAVPAKLAQRVKSDTRWALVTLMESKGNRCSMKEMKEELVPSVLSAKEWETFKQDARRILQEDPYFSAVVDETDTYTLRTSPITQEEKQLTVFNAEKDFYSRVKIIKDFVSKDLDVESEAFSDMVKFFNSQLARFSENVTDRVLASFLLLDQFRNQQHIPTAVITTQVSFSDLYKKIDDKISVFDAINNADLKRSYLENVMACDKSWPELYKKCFPYYTYSWIPNSLKNNGKESIYLDILKDSVHSYRENVDVFLWNYKNATAQEWQNAGISNEDLIITLLLVLDYTASSIDLKKDVSENRKRNDLVINYLFKEKQIFKAIEDGERDLASKIYSIIANDKNIDRGYVIEVRHLISQKYPDFTFFDDQPVTIDEDSLIPMGFLCTKKALEEKIKEKEHIEHVELQEVANEIADARALGDLRENAEYQYGKDKQKNLNARLRTLTDEIEKAQVITPDSVSDSKVSFGTTVVLHDRLQNKDVSYTILGQWESDPDNGILNFKTPLGMKLLNRTVGDELDFSINGNPYSYKVISISVADF